MSALLDAILDTLIPASKDGRMPSAGSLGIADTVRERTAQAQDLIAAGLAAAEEAGFVDLDARLYVPPSQDRSSRPGGGRSRLGV